MSFYYDATNNQPGNDIHIDILVYIEDNNTFYVPNRPEKEAGISFSIVNTTTHIIVDKHIYVQLSFEFRPPTNQGYYFNFFNNYANNVMILTMVERLNKTVDSINNTHLDPLSQTLQTVFEEMETVHNR
jgi:hypothetical protein